MKLSEKLKQDHECGDYGQGLEGYSERAKKLEDTLETICFHLRRNDHITPPTGARCTSEMIDRIEAALALENDPALRWRPGAPARYKPTMKTTPKSDKGAGLHREPHLVRLVESAIRSQDGRMALDICVDDELRAAIRGTITENLAWGNGEKYAVEAALRNVFSAHETHMTQAATDDANMGLHRALESLPNAIGMAAGATVPPLKSDGRAYPACHHRLVLCLENLRYTMKPTTIENLMAALAPLSIPFPEIENPTDFASMSQEARDAVVNAMMGEYENGPPELSDAVKDEIRAWAGISSENATSPSVGVKGKS